MKKFYIVIFAALVLAFAACDKGPGFTIKGVVTNAEGKSIYLSHLGVDKNVLVDSARIGKDGAFLFSQPRPDSYDFYRLQLDGKGRSVTIAIDSTECVSLTADGGDFAESCKIEGSEESGKIEELEQLRMALEKQVDHHLKESGSAVGDARVAVYKITKEFKENIFKQYILPAPDKASAYYALFMQVHGMFLFNPNNSRFDSKCFSAVATSLNNRYPGSARARNMYSIASKGMQMTRPVVPDTIEAKEANLSTIGLFDIKLPDIKGDSISLSSLKGKVVLLDFIAYGDTRTSEHTIALREVYNRNKEQGFEIYQVSLDGNEHFWKTSADNLPWLCVRDGAGVNSPNLMLYKVEKLPTFFLINKENEIVARDEQVADLQTEIEKLLKADAVKR